MVLCALSAAAQEVPPPEVQTAPPQPPRVSVFETFPRAVGFTLGDLSGPGFVYRQWSGDWGFQASGMVIFNPNGSFSIVGNDYLMHSTGLSLLRSLFKGEPTDWFYSQLYITAHVAFQGRQSWGYMNFWDSEPVIDPYTGILNTGAGLGVEVGFFQHLSWHFEVSQRVKTPVINGTAREKTEVGPQFQVTTLYRF